MSNKKPNRNRKLRFSFWVNEEESALIHERIVATNIVGIGTYMRKMAIDGCHITVDMTDVREMVRLLRNATNNINQIAKRANETRNIYAEDIEDLRRHHDTLWDAADKILKGLANIK